VIGLIAGATCREAIRSRSFLGLLALHFCGILLARLVGWVSSTDGHIVTTDLIFSLQSIIGVLVAVATGTALVHTEIKQHTLYTVLSRPMARWHFVVGKYLGLAAALAIGQIAMLVVGCTWLVITGAEVHRWLLIAGFLTVLEVLVMAAVALCWTALSSPLLAAALGLATYGLGHAVAALPGLMYHLKGWPRSVATVLAGLVPNLGMFSYRNSAVHRIPITVGDCAEAIVYGCLWIVLLVTITCAIYRRKQL
jgi:ABC-type transport system involved in multi-copper enzyme maturation permease subunit